MNLSNKGNIILNNQVEFSPKSLKIDYDSLASENSGRTLDGVMHIYWIYNRIRKLEIELKPATAEYVAQILSMVQGQKYDIKFWDLLENKQKTMRVYTSNSSADVYSGVVRNGLYQGVKFNAIEIAGEISYKITPVFSGPNLIMVVEGSTVSFSRDGVDLIVQSNEPGVTYAIVNGELWRYES